MDMTKAVIVALCVDLFEALYARQRHAEIPRLESKDDDDTFVDGLLLSKELNVTMCCVREL